MAATKEEIVEEFTKPIAKLIIVALALFVLDFLIGFLPGMTTLIVENPDLTASSAATAILALIGIVYIINFGRKIGPKIEKLLDTSIVEDIAYFTENLIYLIGIVIAYRALTDVILALIPLREAFYNFVFLLIALYPTGKIALNIYRNLDRYGDMITEKAVSKVEQEEN